VSRIIAAELDARPAGLRAFEDVPVRLTGWARRRWLAANSVTVISLTLSGCAAVWFSAGTVVDDLGGGLALCACYLAWRGARRLAADESPAGAAPADVESGATRRAGASAASLVTLSGAVSSAAVFAGLAVAGRASGQTGTWQLATAAMIMMAVRDVAGACRAEAAAALSGAGPQSSHQAVRAIRTALAFPFGGRVALIILAAPIWGARVTLLALLGWAIVAVGVLIASPVRRRAVSPVLADPFGAAELDDGPAAVVVPITVAMPADVAAPLPAVAPALAGAGGAPAEAAGAVTLDEILAADPAPAEAAPQPELASEPGRPVLTTTLACRDDGRLAVRLGQMVRGQLVPLAPAFAGLAATALLAWLGMRNLFGLLLLTPLIVMLLAAFGSAHPHDRGLDWLTPSVLLGGQLLYVAGIGFSFRIMAPLTFTLCVLIAVHCASLASEAKPDSRTAALGWEGRMFLVGFGAILGAPTIVFAGLAAYLAVTTGARILPRYVMLPGN
jgi:hypothetical protein